MNFLEFLAEARRNPELNIKETPYEQLKKYIDAGGEYYISFVEIDKIGINPQSIYDTPIGIYTYPLREIYFQYKNTKLDWDVNKKITVPFPPEKDWKNIYILKKIPNGKYLDVSKYTSKDYSIDTKKLKMKFGTKKVQRLERLMKDEAYVKTPAGYIWYLSANIIPYESANILWNEVLRKILGYDGVIDKDPGLGVIHEAEPIQAVFFSTAAFSVVDKIIYDFDYIQDPWHTFADRLKTGSSKNLKTILHKISDKWLAWAIIEKMAQTETKLSNKFLNIFFNVFNPKVHSDNLNDMIDDFNINILEYLIKHPDFDPTKTVDILYKKFKMHNRQDLIELLPAEEVAKFINNIKEHYTMSKFKIKREWVFAETLKENNLKRIIEDLYKQDPEFIQKKPDGVDVDWKKLGFSEPKLQSDTAKQKLLTLNKMVNNKLEKQDGELSDEDVDNFLRGLDNIIKQERQCKLKTKKNKKKKKNTKEQFKEYFKKSILREFEVQDNIIQNINEDFKEYTKNISNFNNINLNQIKSILQRYNLTLISDGYEVTDTTIALSDNENMKSFALGSNQEKTETGNEEDFFNSAENARLSIKRNSDDQNNLNLSITVSGL